MRGPEKQEAIAGLCNINPDYYMEFENSVLVRPIVNNLEKQDMLRLLDKLHRQENL